MIYKQGMQQVLDRDTEEFKRLETVAEKLTKASPNGWTYYVAITALDYGQDWNWTTVLCRTDKDSHYQAISPREWLNIVNGENPDEIVKEIFSDEYCLDKKRG